MLDALLTAELGRAFFRLAHANPFEDRDRRKVSGIRDAENAPDSGELEDELRRFANRCRGQPAALGVASQCEADLRLAGVFGQVEPDVTKEREGLRLGDADLRPLARTEKGSPAHFVQKLAGLRIRHCRPALIAAELGIGAVGLERNQIRDARQPFIRAKVPSGYCETRRPASPRGLD